MTSQKSAQEISAFRLSNLVVVALLLLFSFFLGCVEEEDQRMRERDACYLTAPDPINPIDCENLTKEKK